MVGISFLMSSASSSSFFDYIVFSVDENYSIFFFFDRLDRFSKCVCGHQNYGKVCTQPRVGYINDLAQHLTPSTEIVCDKEKLEKETNRVKEAIVGAFGKNYELMKRKKRLN